MKMLEVLKRYVRHICKIFLCKYALRWSISCKYKKKLGKDINWSHPQDLNEKICWLAACTDTSEWTRLANKYTVREYVATKGFEENLVDLYGRWEKAEDIDWDRLPDRFVMKANNGCGGHLICHDKSLLDIASETKRFKKLLRKRLRYVRATLYTYQALYHSGGIAGYRKAGGRVIVFGGLQDLVF